VYEWEADGVGGCRVERGCVYLISSGRSAAASYLYAVNDSGADVFIETSDLLTGEDSEEAPSIYDARENGGFAPPTVAGECLGEGCQPAAPTLIDATPASWTFTGRGSSSPPAKVKAKPVCPKSKRLVKRNGKQRCVARKPHKRSRRRGHNKGRAHR
jgi:hypothetical protein